VRVDNATAISDNGQIVSNGHNAQGQEHDFLLTPTQAVAATLASLPAQVASDAVWSKRDEPVPIGVMLTRGLRPRVQSSS
jgi:hypothetical protein